MVTAATDNQIASEAKPYRVSVASAEGHAVVSFEDLEVPERYIRVRVDVGAPLPHAARSGSEEDRWQSALAERQILAQEKCVFGEAELPPLAIFQETFGAEVTRSQIERAVAYSVRDAGVVGLGVEMRWRDGAAAMVVPGKKLGAQVGE